MYNNMRIYKLGNIYKYIALPVRNEDKKEFEDSYYKHNKNKNNEEYKKKLNNLLRCKTNIKDLIYCNNFPFFITITFNNNFNRYDLDSLRKKVNDKIRRIRQKYSNLNLSFLFIPEKHKNGAYHFHGFLSKDFERFIYISKNKKYLQCDIFDFFGYNNIEILYSNHVFNYVTKYITKDFESREKGKHYYFASQGLKKPILVDNFVYNSPIFDNQFFDFMTDYCYLAYKDYFDVGMLNILKFC